MQILKSATLCINTAPDGAARVINTSTTTFAHCNRNKPRTTTLYHIQCAQAIVKQAGYCGWGNKGTQCISSTEAWILLINASRFSSSQLSSANTCQLSTRGCNYKLWLVEREQCRDTVYGAKLLITDRPQRSNANNIRATIHLTKLVSCPAEWPGEWMNAKDKAIVL